MIKFCQYKGVAKGDRKEMLPRTPIVIMKKVSDFYAEFQLRYV